MFQIFFEIVFQIFFVLLSLIDCTSQALMCTSVVSYTKDLSLGDWRPYFVWEIGVGDGGWGAFRDVKLCWYILGVYFNYIVKLLL